MQKKGEQMSLLRSSNRSKGSRNKSYYNPTNSYTDKNHHEETADEERAEDEQLRLEMLNPPSSSNSNSNNDNNKENWALDLSFEGSENDASPIKRGRNHNAIAQLEKRSLLRRSIDLFQKSNHENNIFSQHVVNPVVMRSFDDSDDDHDGHVNQMEDITPPFGWKTDENHFDKNNKDDTKHMRNQNASSTTATNDKSNLSIREKKTMRNCENAKQKNNSASFIISNLFGGSKNSSTLPPLMNNTAPKSQDHDPLLSQNNSPEENILLSMSSFPPIQTNDNPLSKKTSPTNSSNSVATKPNKFRKTNSSLVSNDWFGGSLSQRGKNNNKPRPMSSLLDTYSHNLQCPSPNDKINQDNDNNNNNFRKNNNIGQFPDFLTGDAQVSSNTLPQWQKYTVQDRVQQSNSSFYTPLNLCLFISYTLTSAATTIPIALVPIIAMDMMNSSIDTDEDDELKSSMIYSTTMASYAVFGTAMGKFSNGPMVDLFGARRTSCTYALMLCISLVYLSFCRLSMPYHVYWACSAVEYYQSVQWPCMAVILATHYKHPSKYSKDDDNDKIHDSAHLYEGGIYITSLGARLGSLLSTFMTTLLLRYFGWHWRTIIRLGAMFAFLSFLVMYLMARDSPKKRHDPQNPIPTSGMAYHLKKSNHSTERKEQCCWRLIIFVYDYGCAVLLHVVPSLREVLLTGTFWVVAIAHSGGCMVLSSARILGTYFQDTSYGTLSESQAGSATMFLSVGILMGLAVAGNIFTNASQERKKKELVLHLYGLTIIMCYSLAFLAIPMVRKRLFPSPVIVATLQAIATLFMGAGVAVQSYCIPAIVGATSFGNNKGLYAAYTDGVAYAVGSMVWKIVGNAVEEGHSKEGAGWAYGWAAVALLVILAGALMVAFMEHYFVRNEKMKGNNGLHKVTSITTHDPTSHNNHKSSDTSFRRRSTNFFKNVTSPQQIFRKRVGNDVESFSFMKDDNYIEEDDVESTIIFDEISTDPLSNNSNDRESSPLFFAKPLELSIDNLENKKTNPDVRQNDERIQALLEKEENQVCVDCGAYFPRWVSIIVPRYNNNNQNFASSYTSNSQTSPMGCFCCTECAAAHRNLGTHIAFVRSVDHDVFKPHEINALLCGGNGIINKIFQARHLTDSNNEQSIGPSSDWKEREIFVKTKYEKRMWFSLSGHNGTDPNLLLSVPIQSKTNLVNNSDEFIRSLQDDLTSVSSRVSSDDDESTDSITMNAIEMVPSEFLQANQMQTSQNIQPFQVGMKVNYQKRNDNRPQIVTINSIHSDDAISPYFTIQFSDGRERQTEQSSLSLISTGETSQHQSILPNSIIIPFDSKLQNDQNKTSFAENINTINMNDENSNGLLQQPTIQNEETTHFAYESFARKFEKEDSVGGFDAFDFSIGTKIASLNSNTRGQDDDASSHGSYLISTENQDAFDVITL